MTFTFDHVFVTFIYGDYVYFDKMLDEGLDINTIYPSGDTLLTFFIERKDEKNVELLLLFGADPNARNEEGYTPLTLACCQVHQNAKIAKMLLKHGADVNMPTEDGLLPLRFAMANFNVEIATILLEHGADINAKSQGTNVLELYWKCGVAGNMHDFLIKNGAVLTIDIQHLPECDCYYCYNNNHGQNMDGFYYYQASLPLGYSSLPLGYDDDSEYGLSDDEDTPIVENENGEYYV